MKRLLPLLVILAMAAFAQDHARLTNSLFDGSKLKTLSPGSILVQGEVQNPGPVDLSRLPVERIPIKDLGISGGKTTFHGAYYVSGYSLYDILNSKTVKKAQENKFSPPVDLYAVVENDRGDKVVLSWGEIYYRDSHRILISKSIQGINPAKTKKQWPLDSSSQLMCGNDRLNLRFLDNPTKISVHSFHGSFASEKPENTYSPEFKILTKSRSVTIEYIDSSVETRTCGNVLYGHGMGFKGVMDSKGYLLKDLIESKIKPPPEALKTTIAVVSAKDGYRAVFSLSEILNRNDYGDVLLMDNEGSMNSGRYTLMATGDFFVDRNVKSVEKIELVEVD